MNISYKWSHTICDLFWPASFTSIMPLRFIHIVTGYQYFIPFYGWIIFHCMDLPVLFIHPSVNMWVVSALWLFVTSAAVNVCLPKRMGPFGEETVSLLLQTKERCPQVQAGTELELWSWKSLPYPLWLYMMVPVTFPWSSCRCFGGSSGYVCQVMRHSHWLQKWNSLNSDLKDIYSH